MMFGEQMVHRVDKHFQMPGHNFHVHAMFAIIEEVYKSHYQN